ASYSDGSHTVSATATDTANQTGSDSVSVTVDNVDTPPSVTITNPANGATVSSSVNVTADASDDNGVTQVEFFVDGISIGIDSNGGDGWSTSWDTASYSDGSHTVSATATDTASQTGNDSIAVSVDNTTPVGVTVTSISPDTLTAGGSVNGTITGSGFMDGASVSFENGTGPAPAASAVTFVDSGTLTATITAKGGGPRGSHVWDVRVTNPDGSTGVLPGGFTVTK
ncbi:MAG: Ig-like domain-containing protein, partial [Chloroflexota bacterium]